MRNIAYTLALLTATSSLPALAQQQNPSNQQPQQQQTQQEQPLQGEGAPFNISPTMVKQVQQALNREGLNVGNPDGHWGTQTSTAIKTYQQRNGLDQTGNLNFATLDSLGVTNRQWAIQQSQFGASAGGYGQPYQGAYGQPYQGQFSQGQMGRPSGFGPMGQQGQMGFGPQPQGYGQPGYAPQPQGQMGFSPSYGPTGGGFRSGGPGIGQGGYGAGPSQGMSGSQGGSFQPSGQQGSQSSPSGQGSSGSSASEE